MYSFIYALILNKRWKKRSYSKIQYHFRLRERMKSFFFEKHIEFWFDLNSNRWILEWFWVSGRHAFKPSLKFSLPKSRHDNEKWKTTNNWFHKMYYISCIALPCHASCALVTVWREKKSHAHAQVCLKWNKKMHSTNNKNSNSNTYENEGREKKYERTH